MKYNPLITGSRSPFVVVGSSKSGTTWLQRLLDAHPQIRCHFQVPIFPLERKELFYEAKVVFKNIASPFKGLFENGTQEEQYLASLKYITGIDLLRRGFIETAMDGMTPEGSAHVLCLHRKIAARIVETLLYDQPEKPIIGTKAYTDLDNLFDVFPDAKVIHIVRDGRDVCVSKGFHNIRKGIRYTGEEKSRALRKLNRIPFCFRMICHFRRRWGLFGEKWFHTPGQTTPLFSATSLRKFAYDWKMIVRYNFNKQQQFKDNFHLIKYEDLLIHGERELRKLLVFLGAETETEIIRGMLDATAFEKLKTDQSNGFFRKGTAGDWKNHFNPGDRVLFNTVAGNWLVKLKYESNNAWSK